MQSLLSMNHVEAKDFFLSGERYCTINLPPYFDFDPLLKKLNTEVGVNDIRSYFLEKPNEHEGVNYSLICNKDGRYAWRHLQIAHPLLYLGLVNAVTEESNWKTIVSRFVDFQHNPNIICSSIPGKSDSKLNDNAVSIRNWWQSIEQSSIELALDYSNLVHIDIQDCYGSIYTHSIAWALHTKEEAKKNRGNCLLGNIIDERIRYMTNGQTNGIPQGSVLFDFIAEIVLGYVDELLSHELRLSEQLSCDFSYRILRYRDDYRIFTKSEAIAQCIIKELTLILGSLGMRINTNKTLASSDVIKDSIKKDKYYWLRHGKRHLSLQKRSIALHGLAENYPNSGTLTSEMTDFLKVIQKRKKEIPDATAIISIIADIMLKNPKVYSIAAAIISNLMNLDSSIDKSILIQKLRDKFYQIPNTEYVDLWLQRMGLRDNLELVFSGALCNIVDCVEGERLWNSVWVRPGKVVEILNNTSILNAVVLDEIVPIIQQDEVDVFYYDEE